MRVLGVKKLLGTRQGRLRIVIAMTTVFIVATCYTSAVQSEIKEKEAHAKEITKLEARASELRYELYEKESHEPLNGKPLVVSMIKQAIVVEKLEWNDDEIAAMAEICWRESRYNKNDQNPNSTAYGLYQFLDSTWKYYGVEKTSDPLLQTVAATRYIEDRYGTPKAALAYHSKLHAINGKMVHYY